MYIYLGLSTIGILMEPSLSLDDSVDEYSGDVLPHGCGSAVPNKLKMMPEMKNTQEVVTKTLFQFLRVC